jgi:hypothetical protein
MAFDYKKFFDKVDSKLPRVMPPMNDRGFSWFGKPNGNLFGDFSNIPIGNEDAQNTAQRGKKKSDNMQDAFKAVTEGVDLLQKQNNQYPIGTAYGFNTSIQPYEEKVDTSRLIFQGGYGYATTDPSGKQTGFVEKGIAEDPNSWFNKPIKFAAMGGGGAAARDEKGNIIPQRSISAPQVGTKEYNQRLLEGSMPGVSSLNPYQQATAQSNIRGFEAQENAAVEEAKKKREVQQKTQAQKNLVGPVASASTPSVVDNTKFKGIMNQEQLDRGSLLLQQYGM